MPDFGFVGPAYTAPSIYQDDQELINWYLEHDKTKKPGERGEYTLYPMPGLVYKAASHVAEVKGLRTSQDGSWVLAVIGASAYKIDASFNYTLLGGVSNTPGPVVITDNGISAYWGDDVARYDVNWITGAFAVVLDGPGTGTSRSDIVDQYIVYNEPGTTYWWATNPLSTVTPALFRAQNLGAPDNIVALIVNQRLVYILCDVTSSVWINSGAAQNPFTIIPGTSTQHGCAASKSISVIGDDFAFVSKDERGQGLILKSNGYLFEQISTHAVTESLVDQVISDAVAYTFQIEGHEFYVVTFPSIDLTWAHDLATGEWCKWLSCDANFNFHRHRVQCMTQFQGMTIGGDFENGTLYKIDKNVYTEIEQPIRRLRRCPHLVNDLQRVYHEELQIQFQPGVGLVTGQGSDPQAMLRWSNDGGSTWGNDHWKTIGATGQYKNRAIWRRLGQARDRVYEVSITDPVKAVIVSANLKATLADN